ncbi:microsomal signal peptidase 12 kDa subunit [Ascobolus immersus RN42]|uniref:Signal peptidase complex subunit 1 n=1 Tax=Ascobolus immersus RN42 TaxID=1160509 RepID=A0A3N4II05_ASCIM|nr:microsomal signal peptidase 12 kDa subunit [Ascobolus immersus RN42]
MDPVYKVLDGFIDFEGQKLVEQISSTCLVAVGLVSLTVGFALQDLVYTLYIMGAGLILTMLVTVPPWPFYNRNAPRFLGVKTEKDE